MIIGPNGFQRFEPLVARAPLVEPTFFFLRGLSDAFIEGGVGKPLAPASLLALRANFLALHAMLGKLQYDVQLQRLRTHTTALLRLVVREYWLQRLL
ncbi:hypothetical protein [Shimia sp. MIT1388]|uniref:hypothetical protein n=1 Tax=Shimia sp. MIT1388 TaxID=3096992 RepID=UPI00399A96A6